MKLVVLLSFILGFTCAFVHTKALANVFETGGNEVKKELPNVNGEKSSFKSINEEAIDLLRRLTREASTRNKLPCKYRKGSWSACDVTTNVRTRIDTLKRGDPSTCLSDKIRTKECKGDKNAKQRNHTKGKANKLNRQKKPSSISDNE